MSEYKKEESKSGFINAIIDGYGKLVVVFKTHGIAVCTFILVLFLLLYSFIFNPININDIVNTALHKSEQLKIENQNLSIEKRLKADKLIMGIMTTLTEDYDIDRVMLMEMHNGSQNLSSVEFLYVSASYEVLNPNDGDAEYIADSFQKQFLTNFIGMDTYASLKHKDYLIFNNLDNYHRNSYKLINKLKKLADAKSVMLIPFCSGGKPLLIMVLISRNDELDAPKIYRYVEKFRTQIEENLMEL